MKDYMIDPDNLRRAVVFAQQKKEGTTEERTQATMDKEPGQLRIRPGITRSPGPTVKHRFSVPKNTLANARKDEKREELELVEQWPGPRWQGEFIARQIKDGSSPDEAVNRLNALIGTVTKQMGDKT